MRTTCRKDLLSLVRYTTLAFGLIILVTGCSRKPNLIPFGYEKVFEFPAAASSVAKIDYPVLYIVDPSAQSITLRVMADGERVWFWEREFWTSVREYQIAVIKHGDGDAICETLRKEPDPNHKVTEVTCDFGSHTAKDYLNIPLAALLHYYGENNNDQPTGTLSRVYYLVPKE